MEAEKNGGGETKAQSGCSFGLQCIEKDSVGWLKGIIALCLPLTHTHTHARAHTHTHSMSMTQEHRQTHTEELVEFLWTAVVSRNKYQNTNPAAASISFRLGAAAPRFSAPEEASHPRGGGQLVEQDVRVTAPDLAGGHWRYSDKTRRQTFSFSVRHFC